MHVNLLYLINSILYLILYPIDDAVLPTLYHSHAVVRREAEVEVDVDEDAHSRSRSRSRSPSPSPSTKRRKRECDLLVDERHKLNQYRQNAKSEAGVGSSEV